jgi:hypothetical protein
MRALQVWHSSSRLQNTERHTLQTNATSTGFRWQKQAALTSTDAFTGRTSCVRVSMPGKYKDVRTCKQDFNVKQANPAENAMK